MNIALGRVALALAIFVFFTAPLPSLSVGISTADGDRDASRKYRTGYRLLSRREGWAASAHSFSLRGLLQEKRRRRGRGQHDAWLVQHQKYVDEVDAADRGDTAFDVIFYGDSIMESTRGTNMGSAWSDFREGKAAWDEIFSAKPYSVHTLAIAGDTVKRLLWRMRNGELPQKNMPGVAVVLIGTNDIVSPACTPSTANRTAAEIRGLLAAAVYTDRCDGNLAKGQTWPNLCSPSIVTANARLQAYAEKNSQWLHYLDLGDRFLTHQDNGEGLQEIVPSLLTSDTINPSLYGVRVIANGVAPLIDELMAKRPGGWKDKLLGRGKARVNEKDRKSKGAAARLERARRRKDMRETFAKRRKESDEYRRA